MRFYVLTLFTEMIEQGLSHSVIGRGIEKGLIGVEAVDIRDFTKDKHRRVDDYGYGGGAGMIMQAPPVYDAYMSVRERADEGARLLYMSPQGKVFNQKKAEELSKEENIIILCGHYEGIDQRVIDELQPEEISLGDFVLTGGELGAMVVIDAVSRLVPGVLNKEESFEDESFSDGLLEYPQYTRPCDFMGRKVPDVLLSGHHENVAKWRRRQKIINTFYKRPDLLASAELSEEEKRVIEELKNKQYGGIY
ncbi:MAG: tRNA (guanosine(37)-N1)-methyltransferase TrmD [Clostridiales bacterium]|nr:tRNA (guanosine(37)-N1)-methyltransferase TrmD [Clostridiales bacterium]